MKYIFSSLLFLMSFLSFSQDNHIVKTDDGRRVLLKADFTWEYIDIQPLTLVDSAKIKQLKPIVSNSCGMPEGFEEPKLDKKIQAQLKKGRATINHIKKKVSKDYGCTTDDVVLLSVSEKKASGNYTFCANGKKVFYKRNGHKVVEKGKLF
ncbi:DUF3157 family protein [Hyunsoonleella pacifica]|uniref:DUF3157 family protein n=1 Tax=Hyunsoonleella pacifica TaxID=1080224 RepID=A0A4Q9FPX8_9FLAO|nr:DUF3157 family protein [Hyunsoonleella pacifica]TBN16502.1 DUF3157 family protein [Hyunsoonleella pacifica]